MFITIFGTNILFYNNYSLPNSIPDNFKTSLPGLTWKVEVKFTADVPTSKQNLKTV